jgi:hypothetical protein
MSEELRIKETQLSTMSSEKEQLQLQFNDVQADRALLQQQLAGKTLAYDNLSHAHGLSQVRFQGVFFWAEIHSPEGVSPRLHHVVEGVEECVKSVYVPIIINAKK